MLSGSRLLKQYFVVCYVRGLGSLLIVNNIAAILRFARISDWKRGASWRGVPVTSICVRLPFLDRHRRAGQVLTKFV